MTTGPAIPMRLLAGAVPLLLLLLVATATLLPPVAGAAPAQPVPTAVPQPAPGSGPWMTGRPEPPMAQRVMDSLIWAWLLGVLVIGTGVWVWTGRRHGDGTDGATDEPARNGLHPPAGNGGVTGRQ